MDGTSSPTRRRSAPLRPAPAGCTLPLPAAPCGIAAPRFSQWHVYLQHSIRALNSIAAEGARQTAPPKHARGLGRRPRVAALHSLVCTRGNEKYPSKGSPTPTSDRARLRRTRLPTIRHLRHGRVQRRSKRASLQQQRACRRLETQREAPEPLRCGGVT